MLTWLLLAFAGGCGDPPNAPADPATVSPVSPADFRTQAHGAAFERLLPLARTALELADPVAAAALGRTELGPAPLGVARRAALREAVELAWREAADIDASALSPDRAAVLAAMRFGLLRARDDITRRPLTRTDPAIPLVATARLIETLDERWRGGMRGDAAAALIAARAELRAGLDDLGACSPAMAAAAADDAMTLAGRVDGLGGTLEGDAAAAARALALELQNAHRRLVEAARRLPSAPQVPWGDAVAPGRSGEAIARLPARIGKTSLTRMLDVEESISGALAPRFDALIRTATALATMRGPGKDEGTPQPITATRCRAAWQPLAAWASSQPAVAATAAFDCARDVDRLGAAASDRDLSLRLIDLGVVSPAARARRSSVLAELALVGGRIAPESHRMLQAMAIAVATRQPALRAAAIERAREATCLAAVALWIHGELGDDAALDARLAGACGPQTTAQWIARAEARPRASLAGLGLETAGLGPAEAVALDAFWWAPLGLVDSLALPHGAPTGPPPKIAVEPLGTPPEVEGAKP